MNKRTLTALQGSIAKWEAIVAGTGVDQSSSNCPLCHEFFNGGCRGCPVAAATRAEFCNDTPYEEWAHVVPYNDQREGRAATNRKTRAIAKREVKFLRSLLPEPGMN